MRYRIISTNYGDDVLKHYPTLDRFNLEAVEETHWRAIQPDPADYRTYMPNAFETYTTYRYYITIDSLKDFEELMLYLGKVVVNNHHCHVEYRSPRDSGHFYCEPTIEIYDGLREEADPDDE